MSRPVLARLGRFTYRRRRPVLVVAVLLTVLVGVFGAGALNALSLSRIDAPGSESDRARAALAGQFETGPPNLVLLVTAKDGTVDDVRDDGLRLTRDSPSGLVLPTLARTGRVAARRPYAARTAPPG